jgi:signal peptidase I
MNTRTQSVWEHIKFFAIALAIVIPIRFFIAQPFIVSGESMVPTFHNKDYLIVDQLSYHLGHPHRGDVVVFRYPYDTKRFFVKRVIGLPNETLIFKGSTVKVINQDHPQGIILDEEYISHETQSNLSVTLKDKQYFVMGDNRPASSDSRVWGPLDEKYIAGRALVRLFPFKDMDYLPGDYRTEMEMVFNPVETPQESQ